MIVLVSNFLQMAKRMKFSVIGLPHYTIWHLYEPSVDDLRHMEEMELERQALEREEEERERALQKEKTFSKPKQVVNGEPAQVSDDSPVAQPVKDEGKASSNL